MRIPGNQGNGIKPEIIVVGSINMDLVVYVDRHPAPGETLLGSDYWTFLLAAREPTKR